MVLGQPMVYLTKQVRRGVWTEVSVDRQVTDTAIR